MRVATAITGVAGAVAGVAAGVVAYQSGAALPASSDQTSTAVARPAPAASSSPVVRAREAGCTPPARLQKGVCVTHVHRTVVVYDAPGASSESPSVALGYGTQVTSGQERESSEQAYDDDNGYESEHGEHEDHGDDDGYRSGASEPEDD